MLMSVESSTGNRQNTCVIHGAAIAVANDTLCVNVAKRNKLCIVMMLDATFNMQVICPGSVTKI